MRRGPVASSVTFPIVTGGNQLASDDTYYYRVFTSSGTLSIKDCPLSVDVCVISGGGGGSQHNDLAPASPWYAMVYVNDESGGYYTFISRYIYAAIGGAAGGRIRKVFDLRIDPYYGQNQTVIVGPGGAPNASGGTSSFSSPTAMFSPISATGGGTAARNGIGTGGQNDYVGGLGFSEVDTSTGGYVPYIPTYYYPGGGAGQSSMGSTVTVGGFGTYMNDFKVGSLNNATGFSCGGGSSGISGAFEPGDDYWFTRYWSFSRQYFGQSESHVGDSNPYGAGTSAEANRGGGGGSSPTTAGNGGSGIVIVRYLKSAVGG